MLKLMKKKGFKWFLPIFLLVVLSTSVSAFWFEPETPPGLTAPFMDDRYCLANGTPCVNYSLISNFTNLSLVGYINRQDNITNLSMKDYVDSVRNVTIDNLIVNGTAEFNGNFSTDCITCVDGDAYFPGQGIFEGNVTAPNLEVMESLIVHGESSCSGNARKCNTFSTIAGCGLWDIIGQRGCHWQFWGGSCVGTVTACTDMSTSTCTEQLDCVLTSGDGFVFGPDGFVGNLSVVGSLNVSGDISANNISGKNITGVGDSAVMGIKDDIGNYLKMSFVNFIAPGVYIAMLEGFSLKNVVNIPVFGIGNGLYIVDRGLNDITITFYDETLDESGTIRYDDTNDDLVFEDIDTLVADSDFLVSGDSTMEGDLDMDGNDIDNVGNLNAECGDFSENVSIAQNANVTISGLNIGRYNDTHWSIWG